MQALRAASQKLYESYQARSEELGKTREKEKQQIQVQISLGGGTTVLLRYRAGPGSYSEPPKSQRGPVPTHPHPKSCPIHFQARSREQEGKLQQQEEMATQLAGAVEERCARIAAMEQRVRRMEEVGGKNHEVWQVVGKVFLKDLWPSGKKNIL